MKINSDYEILTPDGFVDFVGIQKLKKKTREIIFTNGITLRSSYNHKIYDFDGNEIFVKDVIINQKIKSHNGYFIIEKLIDYDEETDVYDIVNAGEKHLYITNGIISHNCDFLGSGDTVIPNEIQENISKNMLRVPKEKYMQGTLWQWKEPIKGHRYILGCLPPDEKVLTDTGLKNIQDVHIDDKLVSENGEYVNIINKQIYPVVDEDIYTVKVENTFRTTTFTKEHPILISKTLNNGEHFKYIKIKDVEINDWIKVPNIYKKTNNDILKNKWYDVLPLKNKDFWWLIGLWLSNGLIGELNDTHSISICIEHKDNYYLNKVNKLIIDLFDTTPYFIENKQGFELIFKSTSLYYFLLENFENGDKIDERIKYIPKELKIELIKGYFINNTSWVKINKTNTKISFLSLKLEILESIQDILFSLDIISSLHKTKNYTLWLENNDSLRLIKTINNDPYDPKLNKFNVNDFTVIHDNIIKSCHLSKDNEFIYFRIKNIDKSKFTGNVYNFECETHTFMCHHITTHNCDVSRGDSEDFSSINIIDFDEREQVLEYIGKIPPDDLANIAYKWGLLYEAFIVVDITGGMGVATSRKLQELNYKNIFYDGINTQNQWEYNKKIVDKIPGLNFNNKRTQIIASFEEHLRKGFAVRSARLLNELNTFVYINGRPDHMKGTHDDSIMSLSIALYAGDISFAQLEKNQSLNKAMLESWTLSERTYEPNKSFYSYGSAIDQIGGMSTGESNVNTSINKDMYREYSWLFGKPKNR